MLSSFTTSGRCCRIEALIGYVSPAVLVACHLPAAHVDGFESGLHLLYGLVAGHRAERLYVRLGVDDVPESRAQPRQRVLDLYGSA